MKPELYLKNRQRSRRIDLRLLRNVVASLLEDQLGRVQYIIGIHLVEDEEMIGLNETHLHHEGATDVITFDYAEKDTPALLIGDVFICVQEAIRQARKYRADWQTEVVRYIAHGILHLSGYHDVTPAARREMKREEDRLVRAVEGEFRVKRLGK